MSERDERPVWSRTAVSALKECRRKFVLQSRAAETPDDPRFGAAAALKKMKNRHLWSGNAVHETIADVLKIVRQGNPPPDEIETIGALKEKLRQEFRSSKDASGPRLFEHEFGVALSPEAWRRQWESVENAVRWFFRSKWLKRLASLGPESWKAVDEVLSFDVNGIKAYVKIDCAIEANGRFVLIDWKTSANLASSEQSLQLAALYAHEMWGAEPEAIDAVAVSLLDGKTFYATASEDALMESHLRVEEEAAMLAEAIAEAPEDPFSLPLAERSTCLRCSFQRLCYPSDAVPAEARSSSAARP